MGMMSDYFTYMRSESIEVFLVFHLLALLLFLNFSNEKGTEIKQSMLETRLKNNLAFLICLPYVLPLLEKEINFVNLLAWFPTTACILSLSLSLSYPSS